MKTPTTPPTPPLSDEDTPGLPASVREPFFILDFYEGGGVQKNIAKKILKLVFCQRMVALNVLASLLFAAVVHLITIVTAFGDVWRRLNVNPTPSSGSTFCQWSWSGTIHCSSVLVGVRTYTYLTTSPVLLTARHFWSIEASVSASMIQSWCGVAWAFSNAVCSSVASAMRRCDAAESVALAADCSAALSAAASCSPALSRASWASDLALRASTTWMIATTAAMTATQSMPRLIQLEASTFRTLSAVCAR